MKTRNPHDPSRESAARTSSAQGIRRWVAAGILTALVLAVVAGAILQASPAEAQNPFRILVSNSGHSAELNDSFALDADFPRHAQRFTTGSDAPGYTLETILIGFYRIADRSAPGGEFDGNAERREQRKSWYRTLHPDRSIKLRWVRHAHFLCSYGHGPVPRAEGEHDLLRSHREGESRYERNRTVRNEHLRRGLPQCGGMVDRERRPSLRQRQHPSMDALLRFTEPFLSGSRGRNPSPAAGGRL